MFASTTYSKTQQHRQKSSLKLPVQQFNKAFDRRESAFDNKSSRPVSARNTRKTLPITNSLAPFLKLPNPHRILKKSISKNFLALTKTSSQPADVPFKIRYKNFRREKHSLSGEYTASSTVAYQAPGQHRDEPLFR